uniref:C-type lectin domain-containing protein n=1 Tax=Scleropages formosus TaxID=113540 RepID=A0A8C9TGK6_SCLFO
MCVCDMYHLFLPQGDNVTGWIGLTRDSKNFLNWLWSDNEISDFRDWGPSEPSNEAGYDCVEIEEGKWNDISCNVKLPFFCSQVMRNFIVVEETMTWEEALVYCRTNYKDLVSILSLKELMVVQYKIGLAQGNYWWTGLRYLGNSWMWVNGDPLGANTVLLSQCPLAPFQCWALNKNFLGQGRSCEEQLGFICLSW